MNRKFLISFFSVLCIIPILLSACSGPAATSAPPQPTNTAIPPTEVPSSTPTVFTTGRIVQEQGSGDICTANSTYFVYVDISSNGPTTVEYRIDATDDSGQVPNGVFDSNNTPEVKGTLTFKDAETQSVTLRLTGPYAYPDSITIRAYVNGNVQEVPLVCN